MALLSRVLQRGRRSSAPIEELDCFGSFTPEPAAVFDEPVTEPLVQLREEWRGILNPQPIYVGIGINDILEEHAEADLLTLLLWRLLENTNWSLGVGEALEVGIISDLQHLVENEARFANRR